MSKIERYPNFYVVTPFIDEAFSTAVSYQAKGLPFQNIPLNKRKFMSISDNHGRSYQEILGDGGVVWGDGENPGIYFGSRNIKGYPNQSANLQFDKYASFGVKTIGMMDETGLERVLVGSKFVRENGLMAERVTEKRLIKNLIYKGEVISVEEWKKKLLEDTPVITSKEGRQTIPPEKVKEYIKNVRFFAINRDLQLGERLQDLKSAIDLAEFGIVEADGEGNLTLLQEGIKFNSWEELQKLLPDEANNFEGQIKQVLEFRDNHPSYKGLINSGLLFQDMIGKVFRWLNVVNSIEATRLNKLGLSIPFTVARRYDPRSIEDIASYLSIYLPASMGFYLAKLHSLGLYHGFASDHNWSLVPSLYDFDSLQGLQGEKFGDKVVTYEQKAKDLLRSESELFLFLFEKAKVRIPNKLARKQIYKGYLRQLFGKSLGSLSYLAAYGLTAAYVYHNWNASGEYNSDPEVADKFLRDTVNLKALLPRNLDKEIPQYKLDYIIKTVRDIDESNEIATQYVKNGKVLRVTRVLKP